MYCTLSRDGVLQVENSIPSALHPYNEKKICEINEAPGLLGLVSLLGVENS